uniref:DEAD/SNF2-like helicase n=1 Tax=Marseillevirus LCMAC201 TaxID=2506605 RepID=A0A481YWM0_9VIRU|nr:MAG: DEAD/SNF2-like helicase [Marseillevirus LCMAC201]
MKLFPHQYISVEEMQDHESNYILDSDGIRIIRRVGVLGDMTGMGKTISMLTLISNTLCETRFFYPERREDHIFHCESNLNSRKIKRRDIYIAPHHLVSQVIEEATTKTNINFVSIINRNDLEKEISEKCDLIIIGSSMASHYLKSTKEYIYRIIIDEADTCPLPSKQVFNDIGFEYLWLITATFDNIRMCKTRSVFLNILFASPTLTSRFDKCLVRNSDKVIMDSFATSFKVNEFKHQCSGSNIVNRMIHYVPDNVASDLTNGRIETAMYRMGAKQAGSLVDIIKSDLLVKINIHIKIRASYPENSQKYKDSIVQLDYFRNRLESLLQDIKSLSKEPCIICFEKVEICTVTPCCQHLACSQCLLNWLIHCTREFTTQTCPCCRSKISASQLQFITKQVNENIENTGVNIENGELIYDFKGTDAFVGKTKIINSTATKEAKIIELIQSNPHGKFLIYSDMENSDSIAKEISRNGISAEKISGSRVECEYNVCRYKHAELQCLFLDPHSLATGLNLENTTDIILYKEFDSSTMIQIRGRGLRLSRDPNLTLNIHTLTIG